MTTPLKRRLEAAAIRYHRRLRHSTANGLALILFRIDEVCAEIEAGADMHKALQAGFNDRLLDVLTAAAIA